MDLKTANQKSILNYLTLSWQTNLIGHAKYDVDAAFGFHGNSQNWIFRSTDASHIEPGLNPIRIYSCYKEYKLCVDSTLQIDKSQIEIAFTLKPVNFRNSVLYIILLVFMSDLIRL